MKKDINLLYSREDYYKKEKYKTRIKKYLPEICAALVLVVVFAFFKTVNLAGQKSLNELDLKLQETGEMAVVFENLEHQKKRMTFYETLLKELDNDSCSVGAAVASVYGLLPAETKIIQLDFNDQLLKITGQTPNEDEIVGYTSQISQENGFSQGQILSVKQLENQNLWEFAMIFEIVQNEGETALE
ncbi:hypothetical protein Q5O14_13630 [Eubacteriaceae bacterium ES2]|nr:hypothetical protein Q5O14_13630 [Eubacteriaceae bacterium ES2]